MVDYLPIELKIINYLFSDEKLIAFNKSFIQLYDIYDKLYKKLGLRYIKNKEYYMLI